MVVSRRDGNELIDKLVAQGRPESTLSVSAQVHRRGGEAGVMLRPEPGFSLGPARQGDDLTLSSQELSIKGKVTL
jgi:hypothetical protein